MIKKLPISYIYCILIGLFIGVILGLKGYVSLLYWGETDKFSWFKHFSVPFINYTFWGLLVPIVYYFFRTYPLDFDGPWSKNLKAIGAGFVLSGFHEIVSYILWFLPLDWIGEYPFNHEQFDYVIGAFPAGFISRIVEYWIIYGLFAAIDYSKKLRQKEVELMKMENQLTSAQLRALRLQLQPHFLFNTLNAISSLMEFDTKTAQTMVRRLGDLLRSVLDRNKRPAIPLSEELEFAKNYLAIEQIRFQDRLQVKFDVDPELYDAKVPNLLLQPLIENAIKHGFASKTEQGHIEVIARKKSSTDLELIVKDDGNGSSLPKEVIVQKGIGLKNVCERVKHIYQSEANVDIETCEGCGFQIKITLPINK